MHRKKEEDPIRSRIQCDILPGTIFNRQKKNKKIEKKHKLYKRIKGCDDVYEKKTDTK